MGCGVKGRKKVKFLFFCKCWNCVFCFEFGSEEFFCFVGYLNEVQYYWDFFKDVNYSCQSGIVFQFEQGYGNSYSQFKEVVCVYERGWSGNFVWEFLELCLFVGNCEDKVCLYCQWDCNEGNVQWVFEDYFFLEGEQEYQCEEEVSY